ncbi:MAG TPA: DoxX family protein [Ktedonobacterales bacterium]
MVLDLGKRDTGVLDAGLLELRGVTGGLMAAHGAQKLFGAFSGPGLKGTAGFMEMLGLRPGKLWGTAAALSEFGGGVLTAIGFLHPFGSIATLSSMAMATAKAHWGKPIWATAGGAETPLLNIAAAVALMLAGPGKYSVDDALGIEIPNWLIAAGVLGAGALVGYGIATRPVAPSPAQDEGQTGAQSGEPASAAPVS